jgi:hypothetical protein
MWKADLGKNNSITTEGTEAIHFNTIKSASTELPITSSNREYEYKRLYALNMKAGCHHANRASFLLGVNLWDWDAIT